jgi:phosphoserine phosphatase
MDEIKIIFFDMEGTLFRKLYTDSKGNTSPSAWTLQAENIGPEALKEEDLTKDKWNSGEYSGYLEWMKDTLKIYVEHKLTKELHETVMNSIQYQPGVKETFEELQKNNYITALISGGFKTQADRAQKDLNIDHAFAACELFWDDHGNILYYNLLPCDYEGKLDFMKLIMREYKLQPENCAFVGDGRNDVFLAKAVGLSISFNGAKELQEVCTYSINQAEGKEDFREILKYL